MGMTARNLFLRLARPAALLAVTGALLLRPPVPHAVAQPALTVAVRDLGPARHILVDASGLTLYVYDGDVSDTSNCVDACALIFPPLILRGDAPVAPPSLNGELT